VSSAEPAGRLPEGLYENLVTKRLRTRLEAQPLLVPEIAAIDPADQPAVLARHIHDAVQRVLTGERSIERRVELVNRILNDLGAIEDGSEGDPQAAVVADRAGRPGRDPRSTPRPRTPLSDAALLTKCARRAVARLGAPRRAGDRGPGRSALRIRQVARTTPAGQ
jgi:hypothetical protein